MTYQSRVPLQREGLYGFYAQANTQRHSAQLYENAERTSPVRIKKITQAGKNGGHATGRCLAFVRAGMKSGQVVKQANMRMIAAILCARTVCGRFGISWL